MEITPHDASAPTYCNKCNKEESIHTCDNCGTKGTYHCNQPGQCSLGELLIFADHLPWNTGAGPGYYCQNCGTPPR